MQSTSGLFSGSLGTAVKALEALEANGVNRDHLSRLWHDDDFAKRVAEQIISIGWTESKLHERIGSHMLGETSNILRFTKHFFGTLDWEVYAGLRFSVRERGMAGGFPWTIEDLDSWDLIDPRKRVHATHMAFWGLSQEMRFQKGGLFTADIAHLSRIAFWDPDKHFNLEVKIHFPIGQGTRIPYLRCARRWHLPRLEALIQTGDEEPLVPEGYGLSDAGERVTALMLYHCLNPKDALPKGFAKTSSTDDPDNHVWVFVREEEVVEVASETVLRELVPDFTPGLAISRLPSNPTPS